jgi:SAM-dependent MidA family methyltransferase
MTPLARALAGRIAAGGPVTVAEFMAECLLHPTLGYYTTRAPFGAAGDFTTAPEISQMFGELIGLALAQAWADQGAPGRLVLAELGPGRGTLMADALRATARVPGFAAAAEVVLVEASPRLRAEQARRLPAGVRWCDRVEDLPDGPLFLVANEFLDALPIRQFRREPRGWRERLVGLGAGGGLDFGLSPPMPEAALPARLRDTPPGGIVELCPAAGAVAATIGARLAQAGGAAVIVDYGGWRSCGDTLQAVRRHAPCDILTTAGEADLTAHVDFEPVAQAARPAVARLVPQGAFLAALGLSMRAERLARGLSGPALDLHRAAERRLTAPEEMGTLFKVLALTPPGAPPLPGTEAAAPCP